MRQVRTIGRNTGIVIRTIPIQSQNILKTKKISNITTTMAHLGVGATAAGDAVGGVVTDAAVITSHGSVALAGAPSFVDAVGTGERSTALSAI